MDDDKTIHLIRLVSAANQGEGVQITHIPHFSGGRLEKTIVHVTGSLETWSEVGENSLHAALRSALNDLSSRT